ncbi:hypothetical protein A9Q96_16140 [Rhodobacterales bacterium 52_120_T64]|nr:hypothetical protein A9Q96_16140 [Rhodobacterales bacterium 52_120_T64]
MQFKHSQKIDAPADYVFARITDFKKFENHSGPTGFSFKRQGRLPVRISTRWDISVPVRGRARRFSAELSEYIPPRTLSYKSASLKYEGVMSLTVKPLDATSCQLDLHVVAKSRSFATSLVFNSIRLARRRINRRMNTEMTKFAKRLKSEHKASV